jgi:hypothetical protein
MSSIQYYHTSGINVYAFIPTEIIDAYKYASVVILLKYTVFMFLLNNLVRLFFHQFMDMDHSQTHKSTHSTGPAQLSNAHGEEGGGGLYAMTHTSPKSWRSLMPPKSTKARPPDAGGALVVVLVAVVTAVEAVVGADAVPSAVSSELLCPIVAPTTINGADDDDEGRVCAGAGVVGEGPMECTPRAAAADAASQAGASHTLLPNLGSRPCRAGGSAADQTRRPPPPLFLVGVELSVLGIVVVFAVCVCKDVHLSRSDTISPVKPPYTTSTASCPSPSLRPSSADTALVVVIGSPW